MTVVGWAGTFGAPQDPVAWTVLVLAVVLALDGAGMLRRLVRAPAPLVLGVVATGAALLSWGYVERYLRGGPRIIDATTYWLEARTFAEGHVSWIAHDPTASVRGRFLVATLEGGATRVAPIFPPGWPAVLALGFLLGHPMLVGPALAALVTLATYWLARAATGRDDVARVAALFSAACAALRYHTADTMSHGLAALLVATGLAAAFAAGGHEGSASTSGEARNDRVRSRAFAVLAGVSVGALVATRPASGLSLAALVAATTFRTARRTWAPLALAAAAPIALFVLEQRLATGTFSSSQLLYYALADGPPGCFRYGFGDGIGCLHEHGEFVRARLAHGFGPAAAVVTTLARLKMHLLDVANAEPLALLVPIGAALGRPRRGAALLGAAVVAQILAYAPFYFDGNYPGGGARLYADVLPVEHVLVALALASLADRFRPLDVPRLAAAALVVAFAGFALHASFDHQALADRDGGRPFFEPSILDDSHVARGLLFVDTDHGFDLAFDPAVTDPTRGVVVARAFGDGRDRLVWERLGRPPAYRYGFDANGLYRPWVVPWQLASVPEPRPWRFEAEAEWPAIAQRGGFFEPTFATGTCAWGGAVLAMHPARGEAVNGVVTFPVPHAGLWRLTVHLAVSAPAVAHLAVTPRAGTAPLTSWTYVSTSTRFDCARLPSRDLRLDAGHLDVEAQATADGIALDAFELAPIELDAAAAEHSEPPRIDAPARLAPERLER